MEVLQLEREFTFSLNGKDIKLPDPNPAWPETQVRKFYADQYGELANAGLKSQPAVVGNKFSYTWEIGIGTNG